MKVSGQSSMFIIQWNKKTPLIREAGFTDSSQAGLSASSFGSF
jgi:hypothetical protein